jgi:general secretion pathway protein I
MVALAVLAIALMAMADLTGNALRNHAYARDLSAATLLARGKMVELEERFEDRGFTDFDETLDGDFADQGQPGMRWKAEVRRPDTTLSAEQLLAVLLGSGPDDAGTQDLLARLLGGTGPGAAAGALGGAAPGGALGGVLRAQLTAFGETLKRSLRDLRLTVSWKDGRREHGFTVSTYLVVLNPRAPGGARGPDPDVPANLASTPAATSTPGGITSPPAAPPADPAPAVPGRTPVPRRSARPRTPSGGGN